MNLSRKILGYLLLTIYSMVLLHDLVPHIHLDSDVDHAVILADDHHHSHGHSHYHAHEESEKIGFFHSLGHLLKDGFHTHGSPDHLVHYPTVTKPTLTKLKFVYSVLLSFVIQTNDVTEKIKPPIFSPPSYDQFLYTAAPLRAPPVLA